MRTPDGTSLLIAQDGSGVRYGTQKSWGVGAAADVYLVSEQCPQITRLGQ